MPIESEQPENLRASVIDRFGRISTTTNQERKLPICPEDANWTQVALVLARKA